MNLLDEIKEYQRQKEKEARRKDKEEGVTIRRSNVQELWELYEECNRDINVGFEDFVYNEVVMCSNCDEYTTTEYARLTEHDGYICDQCIEDGYGA